MKTVKGVNGNARCKVEVVKEYPLPQCPECGRTMGVADTPVVEGARVHYEKGNLVVVYGCNHDNA